MKLKYWSWLLTIIGCTGLLVSGQLGSAYGWAINLGSQVLWVTYAIKTKQYGFVAGALVYGSVYLVNFLSWLGK